MSQPRKRFKLECLECGSQFDNDYKYRHEKAKHNGKHVQVKHAGSFANPFEASKRRKQNSISSPLIPTSSFIHQKPVVNTTPSDNLSVIDEPAEDHSAPLAIKEQLPPILLQSLPLSSPSSTSPPPPSPPPPLSSSSSSPPPPPSSSPPSPSLPPPPPSPPPSSPLSPSSLPPSSSPPPPPETQCHDSEPEYSWINLAGQVTEFLTNFKIVEELINQVKKDAIPNPKIFFSEMIDCLAKIHNESGELLEYAQKEDKNFWNSDVNLQVGNDTLIEHDPGKRKRVMSSNERYYLNSLGPFQPKLNSYPINTDIPKKKQCHFNPAWYTEFPLLEYSPFKDAAFCFACSLFHTGAGRSNANAEWVSVGVRQWHKMKSRGTTKRGKLLLHFTSESHQAAMSDLCHFISGGSHIDVLLDKSIREKHIKEEQEKHYHMKVIQILIDVAKTLGRQGLAFRGQESLEEKDGGNFKQVVNLLSRHCATMKKWLVETSQRPHHVTYLSNVSQNEFIDLLGTKIREFILKEVDEVEFYSIMADTTPDSLHQDRLAINIRYIIETSEGPIPIERLLKLDIVLTKKTGEELAEKIFSSLNSLGISSSKIVFQSYDFARNMSGEYKGTQKKFSEKCEKTILYIPCQAHRMNIFVETACNASCLIRGYFDVLEALYVFFSGSSKRLQNLREELKTIENSLELKNLSKTRWTARAESVKAVWISYESIVRVLELIKLNFNDFDSKSRAAASGLHKKMLDFDFICSLFFTKNILFKIKHLTESLEKAELNIVDAMQLIQGTMKSFEEINNDEEINSLIKSSLCFAKNLKTSPEDEYLKNHRLRHAPRKLDNNPETNTSFDLMTYYRKEFKVVLNVFTSCIQDNLKNTLSIFEPFQTIFTIPLHRNNCSIEAITSIVESYPELFPKDIECLHVELQMLLDASESCLSFVDISKMAFKLRNVLPSAYKICRLILTSPLSSASCERSFSKLKLVFNNLRTNMGDDRLDSLMLLFTAKDIVDKIDTHDIVTKWSQLKLRRVKVN
ncbi:zinc finger MYM-type protein 1-like [Uloborus diversus]|uniref:zinc finger MYM-type protein 1-like n=1 Tax=Uloborus diversus TaxID=327109 RepID=UPI00240900DD|nr:zinc finger MYM-type protein 1-like [Uloborus diversus]